MKKQVLRFIEQYKMLDRNKTILVGVSGGPDSMALLHLLQRLQKTWDLHLYVLHIDHQLREESILDANYVCDYCVKNKLHFNKVVIDVRAYKKKNKVGTQVAARELRYRAFKQAMQQIKADYLALGHHGDDQIETLLMSLIRTTNLRGMTGIPARREFATGEIIRPLLCVTKAEIEYYCRIHKLTPRIDASNFEDTYTRNAIRAHVVPVLKKYNNNLHKTMQRLSRTIQGDEEYLNEEAERLVSKVTSFDTGKRKLTFSIKKFATYPVPLQKRAYRIILGYLYDKVPEQLTSSHEQIFFELIQHHGNRSVNFPNNLFIERSYDTISLYFKRVEQDQQVFYKEITGFPTKVVLPTGETLSFEITDESIGSSTDSLNTFIFPFNEASLPLILRTRKPGDRMRYQGLRGSKKIKDIFIDEKIPRIQREQTFLLTDSRGTILWLIGLRKGTVQPSTGAKRKIKCTYKRRVNA